MIEEWRLAALCQQVDPEIFFVDRGESTAAALRVCHLCEPWVREECLADTLRIEATMPGYLFGIRAGLLPREREVLLGKRTPKAEPVGGESR